MNKLRQAHVECVSTEVWWSKVEGSASKLYFYFSERQGQFGDRMEALRECNNAQRGVLGGKSEQRNCRSGRQSADARDKTNAQEKQPR